MNNSVELIICGDICPTPDTTDYFKAGLPTPLFNNILPILKDADYVIGNLEFVLTDNPKSIKKAGPILHGPQNYIDILKNSGFDTLSLANNHIKDCGVQGVKSTIEACTNVDIDTFGAGANLTEAKRPFVKEINGFKIGFLAFAEQEFNCATEEEYGANFLDPYEDFDFIQDVRSKVDVLIIIYHGGVEYYEYPSPLLQKKCRKFIDKGADLVTCQHSHCIGTIEEYADKKIIYGQGNTLFGYRKDNISWNQGLLLKLSLIRKGIEIHINTELIPVHATKTGIDLIDKHNSKKILEALNLRSLKLIEKGFIQSSWVVFCESKKWLYLPWLFGFNRYLIHLNRFLSNGLINFFYKRRRLAISHNIVRCESHNEVVQELLKDK
jgi:poly-gamma-glutamate synthesis protein (capsule biosynthesis protein)